MNVPILTKYGGACIIFSFGLLLISIFSGCGSQDSHANEPSIESVDDVLDDSYGMEQMSDLERRIAQAQHDQLPKPAVVQSPREIKLEAELAECKSKLSALANSNSDGPK